MVGEVEASAVRSGERRLDGDKARRIIQAMRKSVGQRGAAASTFDRVAREAGVSRGLLHYYFGSKERLLAEVVRHDCEVRLEQLDKRLAGATTVEDVVKALVEQLEAFLGEDPENQAVIYELLSASRRSPEIRAELAQLYRRWRDHLAQALREKEEQGVLRLAGDPEAVASVLYALADGMGIQLLADPDWDSSKVFEFGMRMLRDLLAAPA
ncbi:TetR family transcriptional regulator C-terminal domain-containing protein [Thermoleophilum album]|uniref:TetR/AcrR family transcriptional regulator n=1 Tax=Thermoleophilum album TaxID=29539 RepID=UPI00237CD384|nr:TetR family transcriptional regulator C-terminal domain-containing protein [Thermoleophilum album]WDT93919.1 TetR family transcriptional regulator C-terminal domain-containing protein [Thermoleophilum album]